MKFINSNGTINFENFKYYTRSYDNTPQQEEKRYRVIGKDEDIIFTNGLKNKRLRLELLPISSSIQERVLLYRNIKAQFLIGGEIILDAEPDVKYKCKVLNGTNIAYSGNYDTISVIFDLSPTALESIDISNLTWDQADISWVMADFAWQGEEVSYFVGSGTLTINNRGNYEAYPLLTIKGNVTIACNGNLFTISDNTSQIEIEPGIFITVYKTIYVDNDKMIIYNADKDNKASNFTGEFIKLLPGENTITVSAASGNELNLVENASRWV